MVSRIQLASRTHIFFVRHILIDFYPSYLFVLTVPYLININFTFVIIIIIIMVSFTGIIYIFNFFVGVDGWEG